jgi:hypothetical protein
MGISENVYRMVEQEKRGISEVAELTQKAESEGLELLV